MLALLPRIKQEESSTIGGFGAFDQPRIVEEEQKERAVAEQIERDEQRQRSKPTELSRLADHKEREERGGF